MYHVSVVDKRGEPNNINVLFRYTIVQNEWEAPSPMPYPEKPNLQEHLLEPDAYDRSR